MGEVPIGVRLHAQVQGAPGGATGVRSDGS